MIVRHCDVCRQPAYGTKRFGLTRSHTQRGHGGMDICNACWETYCMPTMAKVGSRKNKSTVCVRCKVETHNRYTLRRQHKERGRTFNRGAGGVTLCMPCWRRVATVRDPGNRNVGKREVA